LLTSEGQRWAEEIKEIEMSEKRLVGDVFISVAEMSYLGPFTGQYREILIQQWLMETVKRDVDLSENYSLVNTLGDAV
jgi:dynein heavy chain